MSNVILKKVKKKKNTLYNKILSVTVFNFNTHLNKEKSFLQSTKQSAI